ncbi:DUF2971 domain-containing protein [Asticcacaulis machinosus]|uniref:DUF2971 domain-containing protein n=1 Tax=Asticcacaulis machinosus TaxID=2984211 RepID=A0ABT5HHG4_9CAUL|nr:DUF2971 domain-containing protein [Asticcacaulis machinosus]MDC7675689.1 DUF2971 domain-containing protein [Asticcacaulis machinosus]
MTENVEKTVSDVYPSLFHYTTYSGLIGILQSQSLWATNYQFLNDSTEFKLAAERLVHEIKPHYERAIIEQISINDMFKGYIQAKGGLHNFINEPVTIAESMYKATGDNIFITSFSAHLDQYVAQNGQLSQWRAYGIDGGYSIEFNSKEIENLFKEESEAYDCTGYLADTIYSDDEEKFRLELQPKTESLIYTAIETFRSIIERRAATIPPSAYSDFISFSGRYKHHAFKEENEVRIFVDVKNTTKDKAPHAIRYRGGTLKTPYISLFERGETLKLEELSRDNITVPIKRIIVGPHKDKHLRAASLKAILRHTDIEVTMSDIPFVGVHV